SHAAPLQLGHFGFDVLDVPEGLARLRRAGIRRRVEEGRGAAGARIDHAAVALLLRCESERALVELAGPREIASGKVGIHWRILQHRVLFPEGLRPSDSPTRAR